MKMIKRETSIKGVRIELRDERGEIVPVTSAGYVGHEFRVGDRAVFRVSLHIDPKLCFIGVQIDNTTKDVGRIHPKKLEDGTLEFERMVTIRRDQKSRVLYPDQNTNIIRLVGVAPEGETAMWNVAIVSQAGHFFLTCQTMFAEQAYEDGDAVRIPALQKVEKWTKLGVYLEDLIASPEVMDRLTLPRLESFDPGKNGHNMADGEVVFYTQHMQIGAINTPKGMARVHYSNIKTDHGDGLKYLMAGEVVDYDLHPPKRRPGGRETRFEWEAVNVVLR